jgi:putative Mg2+ transporter-C (MgtC) family protein
MLNDVYHINAFDPSRIASQIVVGVGFLGAGAILHSKNTVIGLTSAATIWVVAAIGVVIGLGFPLIAITLTILVLVTLVIIGRFEMKYMSGNGKSGKNNKKVDPDLEEDEETD